LNRRSLRCEARAPASTPPALNSCPTGRETLYFHTCNKGLTLIWSFAANLVRSESRVPWNSEDSSQTAFQHVRFVKAYWYQPPVPIFQWCQTVRTLFCRVPALAILHGKPLARGQFTCFVSGITILARRSLDDSIEFRYCRSCAPICSRVRYFMAESPTPTISRFAHRFSQVYSKSSQSLSSFSSSIDSRAIRNPSLTFCSISFMVFCLPMAKNSSLSSRRCSSISFFPERLIVSTGRYLPGAEPGSGRTAAVAELCSHLILYIPGNAPKVKAPVPDKTACGFFMSWSSGLSFLHIRPDRLTIRHECRMTA
jgi:hypothetical protein